MFPFKDNIPNDRVPAVTLGLVLANVIVYAVAALHGGSLIAGPTSHELTRWGTSPHDLTPPDAHAWATVFTAMFLHASIVSLAGNCLFLWIFGNTVENATGPLRFLALYLTGGLIALVLQVAIEPHSAATTVGAGGAIAGVVGAYVVLYARARIITLVLIPLLFTVIEVPALVMVAVWCVMQAAFAAVGLTDPVGGDGGLAFLAQLAAIIPGLACGRALATRRKETPPTAAAYR